MVKALIIIFLTLGIFGGAAYFTYDLFIRPQEELKRERRLGPPPPPPDPTLPEFDKAMALRKSGDPEQARTALSDFIDRYPESTKRDEARDALGELNSNLFFSATITPDKEVYVVKSGDVLTRVASRAKTTPELIISMNKLENTMLKIGQKLIVAPTDFSLHIERAKDKIVLLKQGKFFKQYSITALPGGTAGATGRKPSPAQRQPRISGKVAERISWLDGSRVTFMDKGFSSADHWIVISPSGHSLYTAGEDAKGQPKQKPQGGGYGLAADHMHELATLLRKNDPVIIE